MKVFAALGASVCLLAIPAAPAFANSSHSTSLPTLPTLSGSSSHGNGNGNGNSQGQNSGSSSGFHNSGWHDGHDWDWLKHKIVDFCHHPPGHGYGHGGFGLDAQEGWGHGGDGDRCHPHHPTSP